VSQVQVSSPAMPSHVPLSSIAKSCLLDENRDTKWKQKEELSKFASLTLDILRRENTVARNFMRAFNQVDTR